MSDKKKKHISSQQADYVEPGQRVGRPAKMCDGDMEEFEKLCAIQCTLPEIAAWFCVSEDTIERWCMKTYKMHFAEIFAIKRGVGKVSLRRSQFQLAKKNAAMAIFLGKNWLNQRDEVIETNTETLDKLDEILQGVHANAEAAAPTCSDDEKGGDAYGGVTVQPEPNGVHTGVDTQV